MKRIHLLVVLVVLVVVTSTSVVLAYILTRSPSPIALTVSDSPIVGRIEGNLTSITDTTFAIIREFSTTTYANESAGPVSTLSLQAWTETFYDAQASMVLLYAYVIVVGSFAPNLKPGALEFTVNETGPLIGLGLISAPTTTNLTFVSSLNFVLSGADTGSLSATLTNRSQTTPFYDFGFRSPPYSGGTFQVEWHPQYNHFVGFQATVTGPFTPAVSASILLEIINTDGGTWV